MGRKTITQSAQGQLRRLFCGQTLACVLCGIALFFIGVYYGSWKTQCAHINEHERRLTDAGNVKSLLCSIGAYSDDHNGWCPPDFGSLVEEGFISLGSFVSPRSSTHPPSSAADIRNGEGDYYYFGKGKKFDPTGSASPYPIIVTKPGVRQGGFISVGYSDGSVHGLLVAPGSIRELIERGEVPITE